MPGNKQRSITTMMSSVPVEDQSRQELARIRLQNKLIKKRNLDSAMSNVIMSKIGSDELSDAEKEQVNNKLKSLPTSPEALKSMSPDKLKGMLKHVLSQLNDKQVKQITTLLGERFGSQMADKVKTVWADMTRSKLLQPKSSV